MEFIFNLINRWRVVINRLVYFALPLFLFVVMYVVFSFPEYIIFEVLKKLGSLAFLVLTVNLFIKPLSVLWPADLWPKRWIQLGMTFRREMGVATFWLYLFHSMGMIGLFAFDPLTDFQGFNNFLFWGSVAGMGLWLMALTSNDWAVSKLKRNWKRLHRIVYLVYFAVLFHNYLASGEALKLLVFGGSYLVLKVAQYVKAGRI